MPHDQKAPLEILRDLTCLLLDSARPAYSLRNEVLELKSIFEAAGGLKINSAENIASGETVTAAGVAISPTMAAMCVDDFARTVGFLRGTHDAILDLRKTFGDRPVRVLYAGCGPWAPLAIPLMTIFDSSEVRLTLLDIHGPSIRSVEKIIGSLGLGDHVTRFEIADASTYHVDEEVKPDLLVIEMLRAALEAEPQVAVARCLHHEAPEAVIIPAGVRIDVALVDQSREFSLDGNEPDRERIVLNTVFKLDADTLEFEGSSPTIVHFPDFDETRYRPMLLTTVRVYGEHVVKDYDAGITCPRTIPADIKIRSGDSVEFTYRTGIKPGISARHIERA